MSVELDVLVVDGKLLSGGVYPCLYLGSWLLCTFSCCNCRHTERFSASEDLADYADNRVAWECVKRERQTSITEAVGNWK